MTYRSPRKTQPTESQSPKERRVSRCGSVPNLATITAGQRTNHQPTIKTSPTIHKTYSRHRCTRNSSMVHRSTESSAEKCNAYLHPPSTSKLQQIHRHALSVDETGPHYHRSRDLSGYLDEGSGHGSGGSNSCRLRDRTKRSDTARKHVLARQKPIEKEETHSPRKGVTRRYL